MLDYRACESTARAEEPESPRRETSVADQLSETIKVLYEASMALSSIIVNLIGAPANEERKLTEDKCMQDSLMTVRGLAGDCMGMSHRIKELLF